MKANEKKKPDRISVYSPRGKFLRQWGRAGTGDREFDDPDDTGHIYVVDSLNHRVQKFAIGK